MQRSDTVEAKGYIFRGQNSFNSIEIEVIKMEETKKCIHCNNELPINQFRQYNKEKKGKIYLCRYQKCIDCKRKADAKRAKKARDKNPEKYSAIVDKYKNSDKGKSTRNKINARNRRKSCKIYFRVCECGKIDVKRKKDFAVKCKKCYYKERYENNKKELVLVDKECKCCRSRFAPINNNYEKLCFKCRKINKKQRTQRKRAIHHGVFYETVIWSKVFKRDKYRCKLCGVKCIKPTGKNLPNEWTKGHIVPMALGGSNSYANAQCECRACNTQKGIKALGQQITIFHADTYSTKGAGRDL